MGKEQIARKKAKEGQKKFLPGQETDEQFDPVLSRLCEWIKAGVVDVDVDADGDLRFELPSEMAALLGTEVPAGLTGEEVRQIVQTEMPALVSARLKSDPQGWLKSVLPEQLHGKMDAMVERSKKVFSSLVDKSLKERLLLRKATPCYVAPSVRRVVTTTYHAESAEGEKVDVPVICLEFEFGKPRSAYTLEISTTEPRITTSRKDNVKITVDLHKDDINDLIKKLKKVGGEMPGEK